ncbi:MAG: hypothetical protein WA978_00970 [Sphingopyxis granuli]|uniref:hypothetical protein n=1 Tax=Sphingopyxis granuli TaxID=267128 RepID=UPI003C78A5D0
MSYGMSFATLEATLAVHFGIRPDDYGKFRARIKQLQRLGFPPGVNVGRGTKFEYSIENFLQLAVAFELMNCGLTGKLVTDIVVEHWPKIASGIWMAHERDPNGNWSADGLPCVYLDLEVRGLQNSDGKFSRIRIEDDFSRRERDNPFRAQRSMVSIDLVSFTSDVLQNLSTVGRFPASIAHDELKAYSAIAKSLRSSKLFERTEWFRVGCYDEHGEVIHDGNDS